MSVIEASYKVEEEVSSTSVSPRFGFPSYQGRGSWCSCRSFIRSEGPAAVGFSIGNMQMQS